MDISVKQVPGICADSFSTDFLDVIVQACKFCNRAE